MPIVRAAHLLLLVLAALPPLAAAAATAGQTAAQLRELRERIERVSREVGRDALEKDRLAATLRDAELAVAAARRDLDGLHAEELSHSAQRTALAAERERERLGLQARRSALAQQLRVAYLLGRNEPLQLLLNQQDPAQASRIFAWYGYFGRARAGQCRIEAVDAQHALGDRGDLAGARAPEVAGPGEDAAGLCRVLLIEQ